jgi:hypothetical protein
VGRIGGRIVTEPVPPAVASGIARQALPSITANRQETPMSEPDPSDLEFARQSFAVSGTRVRCRPEVSPAQADQLIRRGLAELADDYDEFVAGDAPRCLRATQYGFDLILGRISP